MFALWPLVPNGPGLQQLVWLAEEMRGHGRQAGCPWLSVPTVHIERAPGVVCSVRSRGVQARQLRGRPPL
jgi:hypothetical protein